MRALVNNFARRVCWCAGLFFLASIVHGEVNRLVIIKVDGLPERFVEQYAREPAGAGREGHTLLPWIQEVFGKNGTWMDNFYVRGLSLSAPSWSMLDTGRHLEIRGNAEYDRYTLRVYDYLNMFPLYLSYAAWHRVDMPGVELLDDRGIPLLLDRFPYAEQYQGFQLYQRGFRWSTLRGSLKQGFGRLIRTRSDRGVLSLLDNRITQQRYGQVFFDSLPDYAFSMKFADVEKFFDV